jgi:hypothetical protein
MAKHVGKQNEHKCSVKGCGKAADVEVILYDVYLSEIDLFFEQDYTCPYLCFAHMVENERGALGIRAPRGHVRYPFSNRHDAQGFTIYQPLRGKVLT